MIDLVGELIDISPVISSNVAVFPGDVPFSRAVALDMRKGDHLTLSSITTTLHVGAHTDAPNHYDREGGDIADRDLSIYLGSCQVMAVDVARGARVTPDDLPGPILAPRLLLRTGTFPDPNHFNTDFAALSPELIAFAHDAGVKLIGLDTPSIDPCEDKVLLSHNAIAARDMAILEGVVLEDVAPGLYTLVALPLPLRGADASPVRAVLIKG